MAVIDEIRLQFVGGFQVLTGETGAGKTILVEAIGLILGNKATSSLIRDGEEEAIVEACFDISATNRVKEILEEEAFINSEDNNELIIKRHLTVSGKNRIFINHQRAGLHFLQKISNLLIDFTGQHEQIQLLDSSNDVAILDSFLSDKNILQNYSQEFEKLNHLAQNIKKLKRLNVEKTERLEWLNFQIKEFEELKILSAEEESALKKVRQRIKNQTAIKEFENLATQNLSGGSRSSVSLILGLKETIQKNSCLTDIYHNILQRLDDIQIQVEDVAFEIAKSGKKGVIDRDPEEIEKQLYHLENLKRKHGPEISDVLNKHKELKDEIEALTHADKNLDKMEREFDQRLEDLRDKSQILSKVRQKIKTKLEKLVKNELFYLQMPDVHFIIDQQTVQKSDLNKFENYHSRGIDKIIFLLSPNPGLSPRPLAKIASGGETSRIFLALKQVLAQMREGGTLIFDEIDTGLSGASVELVGNKLKDLSKSFQVFCVTHHAQIASQADQHYKVHKQVQKKKTITRVQSLSENERVQEIARLMGGVKITEKNVAYAREMLEKREDRRQGTGNRGQGNGNGNGNGNGKRKGIDSL